MAFEVFERDKHRPDRKGSRRGQRPSVACLEGAAKANQRRSIAAEKSRPPPGVCPICGADLPDQPMSRRRRYCSMQCAGVAKRGVPLGPLR